MIPIKYQSPPKCMTWANDVFGYMERLPGRILYTSFDIYSPETSPNVKRTKHGD